MTCHLDATAQLGSGTTLGEFTVVSAGVRIGENCRIGCHVVIHPQTTIGNDVRIDDHSVIGKMPMRARRSIFSKQENLPPAAIGDHCLIGTHVVIYRGCKIAENVLVADTAAIRENVSVGDSTIVGRGVTIENLTTIGKKCKLETGCYITAYSHIDDYCFVAPMVATSNDNYLGRTADRFKHFKGATVRKGGRIGTAAVILPGKEIGEDAVVGAGAVVTKNVPDRKVVVGVPAHALRDTSAAQLLENQGWE